MYQNISLKVDYEKAMLSPPQKAAELIPVVQPHSREIGETRRPAVVICPGGGYDYCSDRESVSVGMRFAGYGVQAFVLEYNCHMPFPANLLELAAAVKYVRENAAEYEVDPDRIAVCGFSAGAHLAGSLAVHWHHNSVLNVLPEECESYRPNGQILCYPVISGGECAHRGSIVNLIGEKDAYDFSSFSNAAVSLEKQVSENTPPCFIWSTSDDKTVPVKNTLLYLAALDEKGIPFESHIFPHGVHGLSLADETTANCKWHCNPACESWFDLCIQWIRRGYQ